MKSSILLLAGACLYVLHSVGAVDPGKCLCRSKSGRYYDFEREDDENIVVYKKSDADKEKSFRQAQYKQEETTTTEIDPEAIETFIESQSVEPPSNVCYVNKVVPEFVKCYANEVSKKSYYDNPDTRAAFTSSLSKFDANSLADFVSEKNHHPANREVLVNVMNCYLRVAMYLRN